MSKEQMKKKKSLTVSKGIVFFGALTVLLLLLHGADEIVRGEAAQQYDGLGVGAAATFLILLLILYLFGLGWTWEGRKLGYVIVLVLSPIGFLRFLENALTSTAEYSLEGIPVAYTSEAVGAFFVFIYLAFGLTSLMTLLLSIYALAVRK